VFSKIPRPPGGPEYMADGGPRGKISDPQTTSEQNVDTTGALIREGLKPEAPRSLSYCWLFARWLELSLHGIEQQFTATWIYLAHDVMGLDGLWICCCWWFLGQQARGVVAWRSLCRMVALEVFKTETRGPRLGNPPPPHPPPAPVLCCCI
jgi:hypothetical protein